VPLYDYRCKECHQTTEVRHNVGEPFTGTCPACGGAMARVFNPAGIVFKGSGFYVNDSRAAAESAASKSASKGSKASDAPASTGEAAASSDAAKAPAAPATPAGESSASGPKKTDTAA
jgi:putative FmdB family regulatory protein